MTQPRTSSSESLTATETASLTRIETIDALTGLRGLAATWVVLHHFEPALLTLLPGLAILTPVIEHGWLGVEVFFLLSGFVIAHNYADRLARPTRADLHAFWRARIARVYPVHLVTAATILAMVVTAGYLGITLSTEGNYGIGNIAGNVALLQALPGFRAINWPAWSVSCEAMAYLAFPLLAMWLARISPRTAAAASAAAVVCCVVGMQVIGLLSGPWQQLDYPVMWVRIATEFTAGTLLWKWWRNRGRRGIGGDVLAAASLLIGAATLSLVGRDAPASFAVLPLIALFVVSVASSSGPVSGLLSSRLARWGGRISYSVYMVHFLVFLLVKKLVGWDRFAVSPLLLRLGVLLLLGIAVLAAAAATYHLVEEPGRRLVRSWSRGSGGAPVIPPENV